MLELINFKLSMWKISYRIFRGNLYLLYINWIILVSRIEEWSWDVKYGRHFSRGDYCFHFLKEEESFDFSEDA